MTESEAEAIHVGGDVAILTKRKFEGGMAAAPYFPSLGQLEKFTAGLWDRTDFSRLPPDLKQVVAGGWGRAVEQMHLRASYQAKEKTNPIAVKKAHVEVVRRETQGEVDINPSDVSISWGLMAMALVAKRGAFEMLARGFAQTRRPIGINGFVANNFQNEVGPIAVVLKDAEVRKTVGHEDIHGLQRVLGLRVDRYLAADELFSPHMDRVISRGQPRVGDAELCLGSLRRIVLDSLETIGIEFPAYLWERRLPDLAILESADIIGSIEAGVLAVECAAYDSSSGLADQARVGSVFRAQMHIERLNKYYADLRAVAEQAMQRYQGQYNKWEWVASRMVVVPPGTPVIEIEDLLLKGRLGNQDRYETDKGRCLAEALAVHAFMLAWGPGDEAGFVPERIGKYASEVGRVHGRQELWRGLAQAHGVPEAELKQKLAETAGRKFPGDVGSEVRARVLAAIM